MKYIVLNKERFFPFGPSINHAEFFEMVAKGGDKCTSAGFILLDEQGSPTCYGRSVSLDIDSDPNLDGILARILFRGARRRIGGH